MRAEAMEVSTVREAATMRLNGAAWVALLSASMSFAVEWIGFERWRHDVAFELEVEFVGVFVVLAGLAWTLSVYLSIRHGGKRYLWLLATAPFVLFWPGFLMLILAACAVGNACP